MKRDDCTGLAFGGNKVRQLGALLDIECPVTDADINMLDDYLPPSYGRTNPPTLEAMHPAAQLEGLILDPSYTARSMAGFINWVKHCPQRTVLFFHTGDQPAVFACQAELSQRWCDISKPE